MLNIKDLTAERDTLQKQLDALNTLIKSMGGAVGNGITASPGKARGKAKGRTGRKSKGGDKPLEDKIAAALSSAPNKTLEYDALKEKVKGIRMPQDPHMKRAAKKLGDKLDIKGKAWKLVS